MANVDIFYYAESDRGVDAGFFSPHQGQNRDYGMEYLEFLLHEGAHIEVEISPQGKVDPVLFKADIILAD